MATTTKRKKPPSVTPSDIASVALIPSEWTTFDPVESSKEETASVMDIHAEIDAAAKARGFAGSVAPSSITFSGANNMKYTPEQRRLFAQAKKAYKESKTVLQQHLQSAEACTTLIAQTDKLQNELDRLKEFLNKLPSDDPRRRRFDRAIKDKEYEISEADERHELLVRTSNAALGRTTSLRKRAVELKTEALSLTPSLDPLDEANLEKAKTHAMNWAECFDPGLQMGPDRWEQFMADIDMLGDEEGNPELDDAGTLISSLSDLALNSSVADSTLSLAEWTVQHFGPGATRPAS